VRIIHINKIHNRCAGKSGRLLVLSNHAHPVSGWLAIGIGIWHFIIDAGGGAAIGVVIAFLISLSLRRVNDSLIEVTATLVTAYGTFWIAQTCQTSGITAVIVAGLLMGNYKYNTYIWMQKRNISLLGSQALPYSWQVVIFWSGLRGALSLAFVLAIPAVIPMRSTLLVSTYAVVLFTLLVQGFSLRWVLRRVLSPTSKEHLRDLQCVPEQRIIKTLEGR